MGVRETATPIMLLDHFAHLHMVHRPREEMFSKKAFVLSTSARGSTKPVIKTIATNLKLWRINRVYSQGFALNQLNQGTWDKIAKKRRKKFEDIIKKSAKKFYHRVNGGETLPLLVHIYYVPCKPIYDENSWQEPVLR